jgi:hypothetical protein
MAATKTAKTLLTSQSLAAAASVNATEWNMSTCYGGLVGVKITNGGSAPTTPPVVNVFVGEATGVKRLLYQATGDLVASSVTDRVCEIPSSALFCNITITGGATNGCTVEAYGQELTSI